MADLSQKKERNRLIADLGGLVVIATLTDRPAETLLGLAAHIKDLIEDDQGYAARCQIAGYEEMRRTAGRRSKVSNAILFSCGSQLLAAGLDSKPRDVVLGALLDSKISLDGDPNFAAHCKSAGLDMLASKKGGRNA